MTFRRLAAIALIFFGASLPWTAPGSSLIARAGQFDGAFRLVPVALESTRTTVDLDLEERSNASHP